MCLTSKGINGFKMERERAPVLKDLRASAGAAEATAERFTGGCSGGGIRKVPCKLGEAAFELGRVGSQGSREASHGLSFKRAEPAAVPLSPIAAGRAPR